MEQRKIIKQNKLTHTYRVINNQNQIEMQQEKKKFNWGKLLTDVIKVLTGALMGWLGGGAV